MLTACKWHQRFQITDMTLNQKSRSNEFNICLMACNTNPYYIFWGGCPHLARWLLIVRILKWRVLINAVTVESKVKVQYTYSQSYPLQRNFHLFCWRKFMYDLGVNDQVQGCHNSAVWIQTRTNISFLDRWCSYLTHWLLMVCRRRPDGSKRCVMVRNTTFSFIYLTEDF